MNIGKELMEKMIEIKVQEENSNSNEDNNSKILRQENDNMEQLTLNGKAAFKLGTFF